MRAELQKTVAVSVVLTVVILASLPAAFGQVRQSTNYQIESDSVNFAGSRSTSTNFTLEDTAGEIATGRSTSTNYRLNAGYQQMQEVYIALSAAPDVIMDTTIPGLSGGEANGSTTVTVTTDSRAGYQLTIAAENDPAMQSGADTIADYSPVGAVPDFTFTYGASEAVFGFTPEGADVAVRYLNDGLNVCGTGSLEAADACWDGLGTTSVPVATAATSNHPTGATTTIKFRTAIGSSVGQPPGVYVATTTLTALPL
jgi:hypothetical protein